MTDSQQYKLPTPELEADIYYLTENEGGRKSAVHSGYRGQFYYNDKDWDAPQEFVDKATCEPGDTVTVRLQTLSPDFHVGQLSVGQTFETREGSRTVGKGIIKHILRPDFTYWDGYTFLKGLKPDIKPYSNPSDLLGYRTDFEHYLTDTGLVADVQFEMTGNLDCMMLVKCKLNKRNREPRVVADKVIHCWKTRLATSNHLYKVNMQTGFDYKTNSSIIDNFALTFATWHSIFLTGQIIVTN